MSNVIICCAFNGYNKLLLMEKWRNKVHLILFLTQKLFFGKPGQLESLYGKELHEHSAKYLLLPFNAMHVAFFLVSGGVNNIFS